MSMDLDFTVAICTYNGAKRLPKVLEHLRNQVGTDDIRWEVIVIDNNSRDNTERVVQSYQAKWPQTSFLKYCLEPKQGLANARQRAVEEAQSQLIGFIDDDNLTQPNWVAAAYTFAQAHPEAGVYGSRIYGEFESTPPKNFQRIAPLLALTDRGAKPLRYEPRKKVLPPGAGLVVRKQAWLENVPKHCFLQGRVSGCQLPGEDLEALLHIQQAGWEVWYNPEMQVYHQIPKWRLEKTYLLNLCRGIGLSRYHTRMLSYKPWQWPLVFPLYVVNDLRKIVTHFLKHRQLIQSDIVTACEMELFLGSLISPFYLWSKYLEFKSPEMAGSRNSSEYPGMGGV